MPKIVEKIVVKAEDLYFSMFIIFVMFFVVTIFISLWKIGHENIAQQELNISVSKNEAGEFAVENFTSCKQTGGAVSSPPSDAQCITETVTGAEKLRGREFSVQVTRELADWINQSKKLHRK